MVSFSSYLLCLAFEKFRSPFYEAGRCYSLCCLLESAGQLRAIVYSEVVGALFWLWSTSFLSLGPKMETFVRQRGVRPTRGLISASIPLANEGHVTEPKSALGNL